VAPNSRNRHSRLMEGDQETGRLSSARGNFVNEAQKNQVVASGKNDGWGYIVVHGEPWGGRGRAGSTLVEIKRDEVKGGVDLSDFLMERPQEN